MVAEVGCGGGGGGGGRRALPRSLGHYLLYWLLNMINFDICIMIEKLIKSNNFGIFLVSALNSNGCSAV